ncbi:MAG: hypothetical protein C5S49_00955 [Candidatus Methanogaster sp.]|nr:MAG: hypothetical protein C5S49_00955 [ANME-2 cluster archaeon]
MSRLTLRVTSSIRCSLQRYMPEYGWNATAGLLHLVQGWLVTVFILLYSSMSCGAKLAKLSDRTVANVVLTGYLLIHLLSILFPLQGGPA